MNRTPPKAPSPKLPEELNIHVELHELRQRMETLEEEEEKAELTDKSPKHEMMASQLRVRNLLSSHDQRPDTTAVLTLVSTDAHELPTVQDEAEGLGVVDELEALQLLDQQAQSVRDRAAEIQKIVMGPLLDCLRTTPHTRPKLDSIITGRPPVIRSPLLEETLRVSSPPVVQFHAELSAACGKMKDLLHVREMLLEDRWLAEKVSGS